MRPISASKWRSGALNANIGALKSKLPVNGGVQVVFYRVHTSLDSRTMKPHRPGERIKIQPGMTANVEIQTGKNTVFRYLAKPITKTFGDAMEEP